ncbi:MAG: hypothetical protein Q9195_005590 [Heterodermia aff. obscurata]
MSTDADFNHAFRVETTALFSVGLAFIALRLRFISGSSIHKLGILRLQLDDWVMTQAILWYTLLYVSCNEIIFGGGSNFMSQEDIDNLTPTTQKERVAGSKWVLVSESSMVLTIWSCKICMLVIYRRLTQGLKQAKLVNAVEIYVLVGFVAVEIAYFTSCRPFWGYWSVPAIHEQCWSYYNYAIVEGCFNVSADICLLLVGLPLLFRAKVPLQQKLILLGIFGMGIFVITAAILCKIYGLYAPLISYEYLNWFYREASVSVYVTNLPVIYSLLRDIFPAMARWGYITNRSSASRSNGGSRRDINGGKEYPLKSFNRLGSTMDDEDGRGPTQSQEHIIATPVRNSALEIHKEVTFTVQNESEDGEDLEAARGASADGLSHAWVESGVAFVR